MKTILITEDDTALNRNIAFALEAEGFRALPTYTVEDALMRFGEADLALLDIMLPDGNGVELCGKIREKSDIPIIFLTSCDTDADVIRGLDSGGDDYIAKPFRLKVLVSRINAVLRRSAVKGESGADMPDDLTAVEQKLLEYLKRNRDRFVTREQILDFLWDSKGIFVNDNTLSVNISRLRDKLGKCSGGQIITKRGIGYKWTE